MTSPPSYGDSIKMAIKAVENVEDPYKIPAFSVILAHLLSGHSVRTTQVKTMETKSADEMPKVSSETRPGPKSWIRELIMEGFFEKPKSSRGLLDALNERGHLLKPQNITHPLADFVDEKLLRRNPMKASGANKEVMHWVNW